MDLSTKKIIVKKLIDTPMILASVSKLFTFYYVLNQLSDDYPFTTSLYYDGSIEDRILSGNLYLKGNGDPYLTAPHLLSFAHQLKSMGVDRVNGNFFLDDSYLPSISRISSIGQPDQADNPSFGALNIEFNRFKSWTNTASPIPPLASLHLKKSKLRIPGQKFKKIKNDQNDEWWEQLAGEKLKNIESIPTRNSSLFTGNYFKFLAARNNLFIPIPTIGKVPPGARQISIHRGHSKKELVSLGLEYSNNLIAESLLIKTSKLYAPNITTSKKAAKVMHQWIKNHLLSVPWHQSNFANGSGLALDNQVSAKTMIHYLQAIHQKTLPGRSFKSYLSINGHSGGISKRFIGPEYSFRIFAKTGSLYYVNNLAGYFIGKSNKEYAFIIFSTETEKRTALQNKKGLEFRNLILKSKPWHVGSVRKHDKLLRQWINYY